MLRVSITKGFQRLIFILITLILLITILLNSNIQSHQLLEQTQVNENHYDDAGFIIIDLKIKTCARLISGCKEESPYWFRIPKPLSHKKNGKNWSFFYNTYLYVHKIPIDQVVDRNIKIMSNFTTDPTGGWNYDLVDYHYLDHEKYYYNVDVLFDVDSVDPRPDWEIVNSGISQDHHHSTIGDIPIFITFRNTLNPIKHERPVLKLPQSGHFKILQVADLHFASFQGICRDQFPEVIDCKADPRTKQFINKVLDLETPDLVVLTGDQIFGEDSFDSITTLLKVVEPLINRGIPYALMFGNHDDEGSLTRLELIDFIQTLPYSLSIPGPESVDGVGNYMFQVESFITIYVLDSHKYSPFPKTSPGYDWLKESQLQFIKEQHDSINQDTLSKNHVSLGFFHIPLPEYRNTHQGYTGNHKEGITAPKENTGARNLFSELGVSVISVGHDHCNDYCLLDSKENDDKIWLCYGGGVGEGGYGGYGGTTRRLRIFNIDTSIGQIETYKRLETTPDETFDHQVLVSNGQVG